MNTLNLIVGFISAHQLGCAFVAAIMIGALPHPVKNPFYMYVYTVLNGLAANLPQKKATLPSVINNTSPYVDAK